MKHYLKLDKNFKPCPSVEEDELFVNGIFIFNISKMLAYIQAKQDLFTPEIVFVKKIYSTYSTINEEHLDSVDILKPVILAEIAPGRYNLIDGHHRLEKAHRHNIDTIKAYRLQPSQFVHFLTSLEAYEKYVIYWNNKIREQ